MNLPTIRYIFARKGLGKKGKGSVELVITHEGKRKFLSTGISCYPHNWKGESKKGLYVVGTGADVEINQILMMLYQKTYKIVCRQFESGTIDLNTIQSLLKAKNVDITFLEYVMRRMEEKKVEEYTHKSYVSFYNKLSEFGKIKFFSDISEKSIRDFDEWLQKYTWKEKDRFDNEIERTYSQATIGSFHKNLKAFINDAKVDGYISENPYSTKRIKIDKGKTRIDQFLTQEEIEKIENAEMPTRSLSEARDLFLIQIFTGLAYADLMIYDFTPCKDAKDYAVFSGFRKKTGVLFTFVLTPKAKEILERYNFKLPKLPNQKYNVKLKLVADAAGIEKSVSSHDGRRSCGFMLLNAGVPISVVSRILGHQSIRQTEQAYARVLDETIAEEIKKHLK